MNETVNELKDIVVIYHGNCIDGFGAAWSAWKKFGDSASYLPWIHRDQYPNGVYDKDVYVLDMCFLKDITSKLESNNKRLVVIDHHISDKDLVESLKEGIFSVDDSGAKLSWKYFHPEIKVPELIDYISDADIWDHKLSNWREIENYIHNQELSFESFDNMNDLFLNNKNEILKIGKALMLQFDRLVKDHINKAILVSFEGHEVYAVNAPAFMRSELGHQLAMKKGPFAIVYRYEGDVLRVSLRGDGSIDVSEIVRRYGGGGHKDAAAIIFKNSFPLSFVKVINEEKN